MRLIASRGSGEALARRGTAASHHVVAAVALEPIRITCYNKPQVVISGPGIPLEHGLRDSSVLGAAICIGGYLINTVLIVGLATLGVVVSLVLGLMTLRHQRVRLLGSMVAIVLAATSALAALWGLGLLLRARAPVPDDVLLFGETAHSVFALKASDATTRWSFSLPNSVSPGNLVMQDGVVYASTDSVRCLVKLLL